jgi:hypothetical protein
MAVPAQTSPDPQTFPQPPQLFGSLWGFTQALPQNVCPAGHVGVVHAPLWQASVDEASAGPHVVPSGAVGFVQMPVVESHVPDTWHGSLAVQVTGLDPVQAPPAQAYD